MRPPLTDCPAQSALHTVSGNRSTDGRLPSDRRMQTRLKVICGRRVRQHLTARLVWPGRGVSCGGGRRHGSRAGRNGAHAGRRTDRIG